MKRFLLAVLAPGAVLIGCTGSHDRVVRQGLDSYRQQSLPRACQQVAASTPEETSASLTFRRLHGGKRDDLINVYLAWQRDPKPIYTPRGPVQVIRLSEAGHVTNIPMSAIRAVPGRTLEDLWPEHVQLVSPRTGDYELLLPSGVPAGISATLVTIHRGIFHTAVDLESEKSLLPQSAAIKAPQTPSGNPPRG